MGSIMTFININQGENLVGF